MKMNEGIKSCVTCKYASLKLREAPCNMCCNAEMLTNKWEAKPEADKKVSWQEAIEAWMNGKSIKSVNGDKGIGFVYEGYESRLVSSEVKMPILKVELLYSAWYIKGEA